MQGDTGFSEDGTSGTNFPLESPLPDDAGETPMMDGTTTTAPAELVQDTTPRPSTLDQILGGLGAYYRSEAFLPSLVVAAAIAVCFWSLWMPLYNLWTEKDGYYSHGFLVPVISGFIIFKWWPRLKNIPVSTFWPALIPLIACLYLTRIGTTMQIEGLLSVCLMATIACGVWLVAGGRWMLNLAAPILYLAFALPLWNSFITDNTNRLQMLSTSMAFELLQMFGLSPMSMPSEPTVIHLNSYTLDVAVPCSGLKLLVALTALCVFIILIGRMKTFANLIMLSLIVPLGLFINGLRIALIGVVGESYGEQAAGKFHDWSGWITLVICFFILSKIARILGWQD